MRARRDIVNFTMKWKRQRDSSAWDISCFTSLECSAVTCCRLKGAPSHECRSLFPFSKSSSTAAHQTAKADVTQKQEVTLLQWSRSFPHPLWQKSTIKSQLIPGGNLPSRRNPLRVKWMPSKSAKLAGFDVDVASIGGMAWVE